MSRIDSDGSAVVVTDPKKPLAAAIANEVEIKNDSGSPLTFGFDAFPHANLGAFGDLEVMGLTPLYQASFATGLRSQLVTTTVANSATADTNGGRLRLQTGTNAAGSAIASTASIPGPRKPIGTATPATGPARAALTGIHPRVSRSKSDTRIWGTATSGSTSSTRQPACGYWHIPSGTVVNPLCRS